MGKYLQESYSAVICVIQSKWVFLICAMKNTGDAFVGVEKLLWETFLLLLFFVKSKYLTHIIETLSAIPVNKSVLGLYISVPSADKNISL